MFLTNVHDIYKLMSQTNLKKNNDPTTDLQIKKRKITEKLGNTKQINPPICFFPQFQRFFFVYLKTTLKRNGNNNQTNDGVR